MKWKIAALSGWAAWALMLATATRILREAKAEIAAWKGACDPRGHGPAVLPESDAEAWGDTLAAAGDALVRDGFEDQSVLLFQASGELLEAAERASLT